MIWIFILGLTTVSWAHEMPEKVVVMGQELTLKHYEGDEQKGFIAEYIPTTNSWDDWELLFAVRFSPEKNANLLSIAQGIMDNLAKKKKEGDIVANGRVFKNAEDSSIAVDFVISSFQTPVEQPFFEHNVFVYSKAPKGIVSYQIARRVYSKNAPKDTIIKFFTDIPDLVGNMVTELSSPPAKPPFDIE